METTERAMKDASDVVGRAAAEAKKAITEADAQNRKELTAAVVTAKQDLNAEVQRIFGGESPELLERLRPVLDKFGAGLGEMVRESSGDLLTRVAKQFDLGHAFCRHQVVGNKERYRMMLQERYRLIYIPMPHLLLAHNCRLLKQLVLLYQLLIQ